MAAIDQLIENNARYAASFRHGELTAQPRLPVHQGFIYDVKSGQVREVE